jgi:hypothetical protein
MHSRPAKLQAVADTLLNSKGHTECELRARVWAFVTAIIAGEDGEDSSVPEPLRAYLRKLAKQAYRISDDDIAALRRHYSEDMIFELTTTAALAAGFAQMDRGLAVLDASKPGS